ncbi:MAG: RNA polymerase sigma factor [Planctomycetota bacterium]|jgi:RNA polymerase sigma-70 factor (ECF subfamily)
MLEDQLLVWKFRRGKSDGLRRIYEKYKHDMFAVASALLHDPGDAEDVVQDVIVSFVEGAQQFELSGTLKGYLLTCVVNLARDRLRARNRPVRPGTMAPTGTESDPPDKLVMDREKNKLVLEALAQLPLPQREVAVMHLRGGMRFRQIARAQGVSINTVQSRYRCAIEKLRTILKSKVKQ